MLTTNVALLVALVVSVIDISDAISCYQCNSTSSAVMGTSTCSDPLNATTTAHCSASMCSWKVANYTSYPRFAIINRDCVITSAVIDANSCTQDDNATSNVTVFRYGDTCCFTDGSHVEKGQTYIITVCYCQTNYCNGNASAPAAPTTPASAVSLLKPSFGGIWALAVGTVVWMLKNIIYES